MIAQAIVDLVEGLLDLSDYSGFQLNVRDRRDISPPQTQRTHMADDVLRTRRGRREKRVLCATSVSSVSLR
jgi:hypothetical protein